MIGVQLEGVREAVDGLGGMSARMRTVAPVLSALGVWMRTSSIPRNFQAGGRPKKWPQATRFGSPTADPLWDTGHLARSVGYEVAGESLWVGAGDEGNLRYARLQQWGSAGLPGGVVRPKKGKFLTLPIVGPGALSVTQARSMRAREFPGAFPLMHGPEGPGIYVKSVRKAGGRVRGGRGRFVSGRVKTVTRIFAFITKARVPDRPFLIFQDEDIALFDAMVRAYYAGDPNWRSARP